MADGFMSGKRVLITGARNKWSIGWHCAQSLLREGAQLAFSVYGDREQDDVRKLLASEGAPDCPIFQCDATDMEQVDRLAAEIGRVFEGQLDGLLHAMAFAKREDLVDKFVTTSQEGFRIAMDSSVYTLIGLTRAFQPMMQTAGGGSIVTLSYLGAERAIPRYNVMGVAKAALEASVRYLAHDLGRDNIRVNAISAGPIKTLAASGIGGLSQMLKLVADHAPLKRGIDADEVGDTAAFLFSHLARGITGEVIYVDAGYNIMGMAGLGSMEEPKSE